MSEVSDAHQHMLSLLDEDKRTLETRGSEIEPSLAELSGDEAMEKSFASTLHSSMWKSGGK